MAADWQYLANALGDLGGYELGDGSSVNQAQRLFRLAIGNDDAALKAVQAAWELGDRAIQAKQDAYLAKIAAARAAGTPITEAWLYQVARLDQLRASVAAQYAYLGAATNRAVVKAQGQAGGDPVDATQRMIEAQFYRSFDGMTDAEIRAWSEAGGGKLPPIRLDYATTDVDRAVNALQGMLSNGAPLRDLTLTNLSLEGANRVAQALMVGAIRGDPIRDIARAMGLERNLTLARAQTIARTEILRANRNASLATMRTTTITTPNGPTQAAKGWKWSVAPGGRNVCGVCLSLAGSVHPVTEDFQSHPNCRCAPVPITPSWDDLGFPGLPDTSAQVPTGDELVARMSDADLRRAYGPTRADLIRQGVLKPSDLVSWTDRGRWGPQPRLMPVQGAKALASQRGWVDPKSKAPAPDLPAARKVPDQDVPGLDGTLGPKALRADMDRLHGEQTAWAAKYQEAQDKFLQANAAHPNDHMHPDVRAAVQAREDVQQRWRDWSNAQGTLLDERRRQQVAYLQANGHLIPPAQARRLRAELDELEGWARVQKARYQGDPNPALYFGKRNWDQVVDRAVGNVSVMRRLAGLNLPLMERLRVPQLGDSMFRGSAQSIRSPKALAKFRATWDEVARLTDALERRFGWNTAWTGRLGIGGTGSRAAGTFDWDGVLSLSTSVVNKYQYQDRLKVTLHELFHSMSEGKGGHTAGQYVMSRGWEEGVVERCTQVWEARILREAGFTTTKPGYNTYEKYTKPLERMRTALGMSEDDYYLGLLETHVSQRSTWVRERAKERGVTLSSGDLNALGA